MTDKIWINSSLYFISPAFSAAFFALSVRYCKSSQTWLSSLFLFFLQIQIVAENDFISFRSVLCFLFKLLSVTLYFLFLLPATRELFFFFDIATLPIFHAKIISYSYIYLHKGSRLKHARLCRSFVSFKSLITVLAHKGPCLVFEKKERIFEQLNCFQTFYPFRLCCCVSFYI